MINWLNQKDQSVWPWFIEMFILSWSYLYISFFVTFNINSGKKWKLMERRINGIRKYHKVALSTWLWEHNGSTCVSKPLSHEFSIFLTLQNPTYVHLWMTIITKYKRNLHTVVTCIKTYLFIYLCGKLLLRMDLNIIRKY